jgi:hypothetical protein
MCIVCLLSVRFVTVIVVRSFNMCVMTSFNVLIVSFCSMGIIMHFSGMCIVSVIRFVRR